MSNQLIFISKNFESIYHARCATTVNRILRLSARTDKSSSDLLYSLRTSWECTVSAIGYFHNWYESTLFPWCQESGTLINNSRYLPEIIPSITSWNGYFSNQSDILLSVSRRKRKLCQEKKFPKQEVLCNRVVPFNSYNGLEFQS